MRSRTVVRMILVMGVLPLVLTGTTPTRSAAEPLQPPTVAGYRILDLGTFGGPGSWAAAVNERNQVVGWADVRSGRRRAFLWSGGRIRDLGTGGAEESYAVDVDSRGDVLGYTASAMGSDAQIVLWRRGRMRRLGVRGIPVAFNDRGQVVGYVHPSGGTRYPFLWYRGRLTNITRYGIVAPASIGGINRAGDIVGGDRAGAFLLRAGRLLRPAKGGGLQFTRATDVNDAGLVVGDGEFVVAGGARMPGRAMSWRPSAGVRDLGALGTPGGPTVGHSSATAVNGRGVVVGSSTVSDSDGVRACRWVDGKPSVLGERFGDQAHSIAFDVNDRGVIVGAGPVRPAEIMTENRHALVWMPGG